MEKDAIDLVRDGLLEAIFQAKNSDNFKKISLVKKLFSEIATAKEAGLDFEQISQIIHKSGNGIEINAATLRSYYFQIKAENNVSSGATGDSSLTELSKIVKTHDKKITQIRAKESVELARTLSERVVNSRSQNVFTTKPISKPISKEIFETDLVKKSDTPKSATLDSRPATRPVGEYVEGIPAHHIDAIKVRSQNALEFPTLETDLQLDDEQLVLDTNAQPFLGVLSARNIQLLLATKKIVAPASSRTKSDFVTMKPNL